ncbi:MAG: HD domain-containing protein [Candidatus Woesearchaeota archaeon]
MDPLKIIRKYYKPGSMAYRLIVTHGRLVQKKAVEIAKLAKKNNPKQKIDMKFLKEAAMLHDIGVMNVKTLHMGTVGKKDYIYHTTEGRKILEKEGFPKHALVCERHIGVGLTKKEIIRQRLDLPKRDMVPISIEEKIICLADKFYTKHPPKLKIEKSLREIRATIKRYPGGQLRKFNKLYKELLGEQTKYHQVGIR